jgi:integrase/recombinase XerD
MRRGFQVKQARVHRIKAGGRVYRYHKVTRARLPDLPEDDPAFIAAWLAEEAKVRTKGPARPAQGTVAAACAAYLSSPDCDRLSAGYRPVIMRHVKAIGDKGATAILRDLQPRHVQADLAKLAPAVASSRHKAWRKLGAWWLAQGMIAADPTEGVKRARIPKSDGHREWSHDDVIRFRAHWPVGTPQRLALELLQWTGVRIGDLPRLGPGMVRDGVLTLKQGKTGNPAHVPLTRRASHCDADRADLLDCIRGWPHLVWCVRDDGRPRSSKAVSPWFARAARAAGLVGLTAHGLRKYRMNRLAEAGASVLVMQAWVGHITLDEVEHYTRRANKRDSVTAKNSQATG